MEKHVHAKFCSIFSFHYVFHANRPTFNANAVRGPPASGWANSISTEKTLITKEKEEKMGQINTRKTNSKRRKDLRLATWNVRSLYRPGGLRITINERRKYKRAIAVIQEMRWNKSTPQAFTSSQ
jgi:hypothetical protein